MTYTEPSLRMKIPLRGKILLYSSSVLVVLIATMLVYVSYQADSFVNDQIQRDLQVSRSRIQRMEEEELRDLKLTANVVASTPRLVAGLDTDTATVRDILNDFQQQTGRDLLIALNERGQVVARTDVSDAAPISMESDTGMLKTATGTYHAAKMAADATGTLRGYVVAGALIDDKFARMLHDSSNADVVLVQNGILGSSLSRSQLSWQTESDLDKTVGRDAAPRFVNIGGERFLAIA